VQVLTLDFHNTLANCDPWFDLEIRDLPWAVISFLDLDPGTLTRSDIEQSYRSLRLGVIESGNEIDAFTSVAMILDQASIVAADSDIHRAIDSLMLEAVHSTEPVPGAADTVRYLHRLGIRLGVVSSAVHHQTLDWIIDRMGVAGCFHQVITSASSGYYKSTPAIYHAAMRDLDGDASTSVHVGDSLRWDVETAQQAGMNAVWLRTQRREVFNTAPHTAVPSLTLDTMEDAGPALAGFLEQVAGEA
jgi:HAD superfamily hydrolase (TIGR01509 family)